MPYAAHGAPDCFHGRPALPLDQRSVGRQAGFQDTPPVILSSAISTDEGKTFTKYRDIANNPEDDFGYQCIEFLGKDTAVMAYHARDGLHVAQIAVPWFYGN